MALAQRARRPRASSADAAVQPESGSSDGGGTAGSAAEDASRNDAATTMAAHVAPCTVTAASTASDENGASSLPGEPVVDFIASLRSLAAMSVADSSKKARPSIFQKPSRLRERMNLCVCSWSNSLRTQCSNFLLRGAMAPLLRLGAAVNMAAHLHNPFVAVNIAAPPHRDVGKPSTWRPHDAEFILSGSASSFGLAAVAQTNTVTVLNVDSLGCTQLRNPASWFL
ncbi:hypothetical protein HPB52_010972 [Rhipicephalus sanguineus]|uniref:Uncharacterized protein n=1 Tax=Rhipicephalus sanguineus TaxID=34632 RepID=A0A9D4PWU4_RHISA|nr:hypothetical protein HPB52_010972 [Rhipicephalus sanguineus]